MNILDDLRHVRGMLDISQKELAKKLKIDPAIICRIEQGYRPKNSYAAEIIGIWIEKNRQEADKQLQMQLFGRSEP